MGVRSHPLLTTNGTVGPRDAEVQGLWLPSNAEAGNSGTAMPHYPGDTSVRLCGAIAHGE